MTNPGARCEHDRVSLLVLLPWIALATFDADAALQRADAHVQNLDYELAREELLELLEHNDELTPAQRRDAHMMAGTVARILNRDTESRMHYAAALEADPEASLPPGQPPKITTFFDLVKQERAARAPLPAPAPEVAPPPAPPPAAPASTPHLLYLGAVAGGVAAAGLGAAVLGVGLLPLAQYGLAKTALDDKVSQRDASGVRDLYTQQDNAASSFETWGLPLVVVGAATVGLGVVVGGSAGGLWLVDGMGE